MAKPNRSRQPGVNRSRTARLLVPMLVAASAAVPGEEAAGQTPSTETSACVVRTKRFDQHEYVCTLPPNGARQLRIVANFSGSHDDTMASLAATRDGAPFACAAESKTRTMGEDGDVSLDCRIALAERGAGSREVVVLVKWSHAEFVGLETFAE